ncbi:MAG: ribonuclease P protein component [Clostridia bacterium]|nr:ribonuclease P protein component [Clostridia bacterium]
MKFTSITENHLYQKAYAKGKRFVTPALAVYILPDYKAGKLQKAHPQHIRVNRIGLTVTKKVGGAVVRSRVRRILREAYRQTVATHPIKTGFLIVLVAREKAVKMKSTELEKDLFRAFSHLEMFSQ